MAAMGPYDSALQMFVQTPRTVDMSRLIFMRWLAEHGRLEHHIAGPSSGPLVAQQESLKVPDLPVAAA
jgi:hypothetical protein